MTDLHLFLGLPVDLELLNRLKSSRNYALLFSPHSDDLTEVEGPDSRYVGKKLSQFIERESLHNTEANIYSLLNKLDPGFSFKSIPLTLFPYSDE